MPARTARASGGSMKGKASTSPRPRESMRSITEASEVRWISGWVNSSRAAKSACEYRRMQTPSATRPHRPARWSALAREIGSMGRR